ncbi:MAG: SDR family oxidoreductase [Saprospiraceae bacterium]
MNTEFNFIYCLENQSIVNKLTQDLAGAAAIFHLVNAENEESIKAALTSGSLSFLLLTDNFLKSQNCMRNAYRNSQNAFKLKKLAVVLADGFVVEPNGNIVKVPTQIERVSQWMFYLNFWQEKFLETKKQYNDNFVSYEDMLLVKSISSEISDFLQNVRDSGFYYFENFIARNYQQFGQLTGLQIQDATEKQPDQQFVNSAHSTDNYSEDTMAALPTHFVDIDKTDTTNDVAIVDVKEERTADLALKMHDLHEHSVPKNSNRLKEIDEDDFFTRPGSSNGGSNINEIVDEVLSEEEEEDRVQNYGKYVDIDDMLTEESLDDVDELFVHITNPSNKIDASISFPERPKTSKVKKNVTSTNPSKNQSVSGRHKNSKQTENIFFIKQLASKNTIDSMADNNIIKAELQSAFMEAQKGNLNLAAKHLDEILYRNIDSSEAHFLRAEVAELQSDFAKARTHFEKVVELAPYFPKVYHKLSWLFMNHFPQERKSIKTYFKRAIDFDERNAELINTYAEFLNEGGDTEKAIKYFKKVLKVDPNHPFANYDLALIAHKAGDYATANRYYLEACENNEELSTPENDQAFTNYTILDVKRAGEAINLHNLEEEEKMQPVDFVDLEDSDLSEINEEEEIADQIANESENFAFADEKPRQNKYKPLKGAKIVLITGASAGIGRATAEIFAKNGYNLILTARREDRLIELQNNFHKLYQGGCIILTFDIRNFGSIQTTLNDLDKEWRAIDILINNAGLAIGMDPVNEGNPEHWDTMIDTNIKGLLYMTRLISPGMVDRKTGHIINLCSTAGKEAYPNGNVYSATKFAVDALTRNMRIDLHKYGIRVGQVSPGAVEETEFSQVRFLGDKERAAKIYEGFVPLRAVDIADIIYFMADAPAHVNIQDILVMGTQQASASIIDRSGR